MMPTAKLTVDLTPELLNGLNQLSEVKQTSPSNLAAEILRGFLAKEAGLPLFAGDSRPRTGERRRSRPSHGPEEIVADIQKILDSLSAVLPVFDPDHPLAAEVEALIRRAESEREGGF